MRTGLLEKLRTRPAFARIPQSEDSEELLSNSGSSEQLTTTHRDRWPRAIVVPLLVLSFGIVFLAGTWLGSAWRFDPASFCIRYTSNYSPVLRDVDISYDTVRFNGSLMKENIFRRPASPEVDAAWTSLGVDYRSVVVPASQAAQSGLLPDQVKVSPKYGGGYPANVEGLHHLHCLNLLRQSLYYNFDYYHAMGKGAFKNNDTILRYHVSHCLDILRQQLMCTVDVGVLGQVWWNPEAPSAYVDFNTQHKCRNFDAIRRWAEVNQAPDEVPPDYLQPPADGDTIYGELP